MAKHPYLSIPAHQLWRRSIASEAMDQVDPVVSAKFTIGPEDRVATAGSCFAQHIARHLKQVGFNYFVTEPPHPIVPPDLIEPYNYGIFTARYGNIYTTRQLLQTIQRAYGVFEPKENVWDGKAGSVIDPFRPQIQPHGFISVTEMIADREQHFAAIRRAVEQLDVLVFTLGLTEAWIDRDDGAVFPICPGVAGGVFDESRFAFHNMSVADVTADLREAIRYVRSKNPSCRIVLTVSPVPLVATAMDRSVLVSTTYSKSVLRVAAEEIAGSDPAIAYFPSYEIITGNFNRGAYFAEDLRSVTEAGVNHVMRLFLKHYTTGAVGGVNPSAGDDGAYRTLQADQAMADVVAVICDEEVLGRAAEASAA